MEITNEVYQVLEPPAMPEDDYTVWATFSTEAQANQYRDKVANLLSQGDPDSQERAKYVYVDEVPVTENPPELALVWQMTVSESTLGYLKDRPTYNQDGSIREMKDLVSSNLVVVTKDSPVSALKVEKFTTTRALISGTDREAVIKAANDLAVELASS